MKKLIIALIIINAGFTFAQFRLDNWKSHSSIVKINHATFDSKYNLWFATDGGIFTKSQSDNSEKNYTNVESLLNNQISTIYFDNNSGRIYAGSKDGVLEIYENGKWIHISDIKNQKFANPEIKEILNVNGKIYIAGGFGLAIFDPINLVFLESVLKIGSFTINTPVNDILIKDNIIWLATDEGLANASIESFLPNPKQWTNYTIKEGLYQNKVTKIDSYNNIIYIMSERFILTYDNNKFEQFAESIYQFQNMFVLDNNLYYADWYNVYNQGKDAITMPHNDLIDNIFGAKINNQEYIIISYRNYGYAIYSNNKYDFYLPNTPYSNIAKEIEIDPDGNLWLASGVGFSKYDGKNWTNFLNKFTPQIIADGYHRIKVDVNGRIIASNYGLGLLIGEKIDTGYNFTLFNEKNSKFMGLGDAPEFIVAGESAVDFAGRIWVTNLGEFSNGPALLCFDYDGQEYKSYGFTNPRIANQRTFMTLAIDPYGTKWVGGNNPSGTGLMYYNEMGTLDNENDDIAGVITSSNNPNLLDNLHNSITVDKSGMVWIATPRGVVVINNPSQVLNGTTANLNVRNLNRLIGEVNINDIMVDALDNKWIATSNGVWVIDPLATDTIAYISMENYPLPTNEVISLAANPYTGKVYFGTNLGLYEASSLSVEPVPNYDIMCYPQPFNPIKDNEMVIDGLSDFSEVRILTTSGELIRSINTASRKTIWDGKDTNGNHVKSGIYIISAKSATGEVSGVQKIAIVNK